MYNNMTQILFSVIWNNIDFFILGRIQNCMVPCIDFIKKKSLNTTYIVHQGMNHDSPFFSNISSANMLFFMTNHFINNTSLGTRLCGIYFKFLWFYVGCWCAFNRIWVVFSEILLHPELKRHFRICSVRSFVWTIINQLMGIKF